MPRRQRVAKRRITPAGELAAWNTYFEFGVDWFHDLSRAGITGTDAKTLAPDAWQLLGQMFLSDYVNDEVPFAFKQFGDPRGARSCR